MTLKTDMQWIPGEIRRPDPFGVPVDDMIHDAAYAHAMTEAIKECCTKYTRSHIVNWLEIRSAELMKEWGYSE